MRFVFALSVFALFAVAFDSSPAAASEPAGVWIIPDEVVLMPNAEQPTSIRLSGMATVHSGTGPINEWGYAGFETPRRGTLYYNCPAGKQSLCRTEWLELRDARGRCVGFGSLDANNGTLRDTNTPTAPEPYPLGIGVVIGFTPCRLLERAADGGTPEPENDASSASSLPDASPTEPHMPNQADAATARPPVAPGAASGSAGSPTVTPAPAAVPLPRAPPATRAKP